MLERLYEIVAARYTAVTALFAGLDHSTAIIHAVLERKSPGRVFVDDPRCPRLALLYAGGAFCYVAGDADRVADAALAEALFERLMPAIADHELVVFALDDALRARLDALLGARGAIRIQRLVFRFRPERYAALPPWRERVPAGVTVRAVDNDLAERYPDFGGTATAALVDLATGRYGVMVLRDGEPLSVCSAVYVGGGAAETDVHTVEAHRGRGYATLAASAYIEATLARDVPIAGGLCPHWACWPDRQASRALALRLGFEEQPPAMAHYWAPGVGEH